MNKIAVSIGADDDQLCLFYRKMELNKPYKKAYRSYMHCNDTVHTWMIENNINYNLDYNFTDDGLEYFIIFNNKKDAILFKLTWCGK